MLHHYKYDVHDAKYYYEGCKGHEKKDQSECIKDDSCRPCAKRVDVPFTVINNPEFATAVIHWKKICR